MTGPCSSGKRSYATEAEAQIALLWMRDGAPTGKPLRSRRPRLNVRAAYECPECGAWHLTSRGPMRRRPLPKRRSA